MVEAGRVSEAVPTIGLALAGGAPGGAIYEIGALRALDEALDGLDLRDCGVYVGISAGAFLTACLANGLSTSMQCRAIVKDEPGEHPFVPEIFFQPAFGELARRVASLPKHLLGALGNYVTRREKRLLDALTVVGRSLPVGVFDNEPIRDYVERIFSIKGRTDDFQQLQRKLTVVATDLESGEVALFGNGGWGHVPISSAVQASTALPGLYPPVEIEGRYYVDGILRKTMNTSVALEAGAKLVFCINPLVPVDTRSAVQQNILPSGQVIDRGLTAVLSQTVRAMIHSRMNLGFRAYDTQYPDADLILIEPPREDHEDFFSNIFSFSSRRAICEHAYEVTRRNLWDRREELEPILERHGLALNLGFLEDESRDLWTSVGLPELSLPTNGRVEKRSLFSRKKDKKAPASKAHHDPSLTQDVEGLLARVEKLVVNESR